MNTETSQPQPVDAQPLDQASITARMGIEIKLGVHLDDGTTKELTLVAHNFKIEKEQQA